VAIRAPRNGIGSRGRETRVAAFLLRARATRLIALATLLRALDLLLRVLATLLRALATLSGLERRGAPARSISSATWR
jgi:hypothetical protein